MDITNVIVSPPTRSVSFAAGTLDPAWTGLPVEVTVPGHADAIVRSRLLETRKVHDGLVLIATEDWIVIIEPRLTVMLAPIPADAR